MTTAIQMPVTPGTPRVISPTPPASEAGSTSGNDYFPPQTRSAARRTTKAQSPPPIAEDASETSSGSDPEMARARSRSRSADAKLRRRRMSGLTATEGKNLKQNQVPPVPPVPKTPAKDALSMGNGTANGTANGHLSPASAAKYYWREFSRSPSPLGLIPIHREWRNFVHRHEIPRKILHVSIGFLTLGLYASGSETRFIHPVLFRALIPITLVDVLRHNWSYFNQVYIKMLGAFMRESEAHNKYNGVIFYLAGAWAVMRFCPKDIAVMSVLLLSWCDTAASTVGRQWGRYTPRIRKGKSLAGSLAAFAVGLTTAVFFWGFIAPYYEAKGISDNTGDQAFAFQGTLTFPGTETAISGAVALGIMSIWAGFVASFSEAIDIFGLDDNVTIPILCGVGLWGFTKLFSVSLY